MNINDNERGLLVENEMLRDENERAEDFRAEIVKEAFTAPDAGWNVILDSLRARISDMHTDLDSLRAELQAKDEALREIVKHTEPHRNDSECLEFDITIAHRALTPPTKEETP